MRRPEQTARWTQSALLVFVAGRPLRFYNKTSNLVTGEMVLMPLADEMGNPRFVLAYGRYEPTRDWSKREAKIPA